MPISKPTELDTEYDAMVEKLDKIIQEATRVSRAAGGRYVDTQRGWASLLFVRLCVSAQSVLVLAPRSRFDLDLLAQPEGSEKSEEPLGLLRKTISLRRRDFWDFSAVGSLVRNLFETYFVFFYIGVDQVAEDEWKTRLNVMHLHDCVSRIKMFRYLGTNTNELATFEAHADELRQRLLCFDHFKSLVPKQQKMFLRGERALMLTSDEISGRLSESVEAFRGYYIFLSTHVHTLPMSFYRTGEKGRGIGLENDVEKGYLSQALESAGEFLDRATKDMIMLFPDLAKAKN